MEKVHKSTKLNTGDLILVKDIVVAPERSLVAKVIEVNRYKDYMCISCRVMSHGKVINLFYFYRGPYGEIYKVSEKEGNIELL